MVAESHRDSVAATLSNHYFSQYQKGTTAVQHHPAAANRNVSHLQVKEYNRTCAWSFCVSSPEVRPSTRTSGSFVTSGSCAVPDLLLSTAQNPFVVWGEPGLADFRQRSACLYSAALHVGGLRLCQKTARPHVLRTNNFSALNPAVSVCYAPESPPSIPLALHSRFRHPRSAASPVLPPSTVLQIASPLRPRRRGSTRSISSDQSAPPQAKYVLMSYL